MAEHLIRNQEVASSSLARGFLIRYAVRVFKNTCVRTQRQHFYLCIDSVLHGGAY